MLLLTALTCCFPPSSPHLQELLGSDKSAEGSVPRSVEVELSGDLVHGAVVGDVVAVVGLVRVMATGDDLGERGKVGGTGGRWGRAEVEWDRALGRWGRETKHLGRGTKHLGVGARGNNVALGSGEERSGRAVARWGSHTGIMVTGGGGFILWYETWDLHRIAGALAASLCPAGRDDDGLRPKPPW